jgi:hypothetical protein
VRFRTAKHPVYVRSLTLAQPLLFEGGAQCAMLSVKTMSPRRPRIPEISFCSDKQRLMNEFLMAIKQVTDLLGQQAEAVIEWDPAFSRFDLLLHLAHEKKDAAKYALITHIEAHHCEEG